MFNWTIQNSYYDIDTTAHRTSTVASTATLRHIVRPQLRVHRHYGTSYVHSCEYSDTTAHRTSTVASTATLRHIVRPQLRVHRHYGTSYVHSYEYSYTTAHRTSTVASTATLRHIVRPQLRVQRHYGTSYVHSCEYSYLCSAYMLTWQDEMSCAIVAIKRFSPNLLRPRNAINLASCLSQI